MKIKRHYSISISYTPTGGHSLSYVSIEKTSNESKIKINRVFTSSILEGSFEDGEALLKAEYPCGVWLTGITVSNFKEMNIKI